MSTRIIEIANASFEYDDLPILKKEYQPKLDGRVVKGDGHGNWRNILWDAQIHGLVKLTREQNNRFNKLYRIPGKKLTRENIAEMAELLSQVTFRNDIEKYHLIGDLLSDRGQCDLFMLALLHKIRMDNLPSSINRSNHDNGFLKIYQNDFVFNHQKGYHNRNLTMFYENEVSGGGGQSVSLENLGWLLADGRITRDDINFFMPSYFENLKLIDYISPNKKDILLLTHAPCPISVKKQIAGYEKIAKLLGVKFNDNNVTVLKRSIDRINKKHAEMAKNKDARLFEGSLAKAISEMVWYRWMGDQGDVLLSENAKGAMSGKHKGYNVRYLYGHVGLKRDASKAPQVPMQNEDYDQTNISRSVDTDFAKDGISEENNQNKVAFSCVIDSKNPMQFEHIKVDYFDPNNEIIEISSYERALLPFKKLRRDISCAIKFNQLIANQLVLDETKQDIAAGINQVARQLAESFNVDIEYSDDEESIGNIIGDYNSSIEAIQRVLNSEQLTTGDLNQYINFFIARTRLVAKTINSDDALVEKQAYLREYRENYPGAEIPEAIFALCKMQERNGKIVAQCDEIELEEEIIDEIDDITERKNEDEEITIASEEFENQFEYQNNRFVSQAQAAPVRPKVAYEKDIDQINEKLKNANHFPQELCPELFPGLNTYLKQLGTYEGGPHLDMFVKSKLSSFLSAEDAKKMGDLIQDSFSSLTTYILAKIAELNKEVKDDPDLQEINRIKIENCVRPLIIMAEHIADAANKANNTQNINEMFSPIHALLDQEIDAQLNQLLEQAERKKEIIQLKKDYKMLSKEHATPNLEAIASLSDTVKLIRTVVNNQPPTEAKADVIAAYHEKYFTKAGDPLNSSPFQMQKKKAMRSSVFRGTLIAGGFTGGVICAFFAPPIAIGILAISGIATVIHARQTYAAFFKPKKLTEKQLLGDTKEVVHARAEVVHAKTKSLAG